MSWQPTETDYSKNRDGGVWPPHPSGRGQPACRQSRYKPRISAVPTPLPSSFSSSRGPRPAAVIQSDPRGIPRLIEVILSRAGMPAAEVARRLGIQPQALNQYRTGRRINPSVLWLARLAAVCGGRVVVEFPEREMALPAVAGRGGEQPAAASSEGLGTDAL